MKIAIAGSSGFVGSEVERQLVANGHVVVRVHAPRLAPVSSSSLTSFAANIDVPSDLIDVVRGCVVLVNAAGNPDASEASEDALNGPNALLVALLAKLSVAADIPRFVHISSAVVQGDRAMLDSSTEVVGFSPYARSKIAGEKFAHEFGPTGTVVYRPPSVHHESRRVTQQLHRIANSVFSTVASPGDAPTPQVLLADVGAAVVMIATTKLAPPEIVHHPWAGLTTSSLLAILGNGRQPLKIPRILATAMLSIGKVLGVALPSLKPYVRRVELVWFGQEQADSWLQVDRAGTENWQDLALQVEMNRTND